VQVSGTSASETCATLAVAPLGYVPLKVALSVIATSQHRFDAVEPARRRARASSP